jgi:hypothetical protein
VDGAYETSAKNLLQQGIKTRQKEIDTLQQALAFVAKFQEASDQDLISLDNCYINYTTGEVFVAVKPGGEKVRERVEQILGIGKPLRKNPSSRYSSTDINEWFYEKIGKLEFFLNQPKRGRDDWEELWD